MSKPTIKTTSADRFIDFGALAPKWTDGTDPAHFAPDEIDRIKNAPDRASEIEARLAEKARDLPLDIRALGY
jgi:hypothetical protein